MQTGEPRTVTFIPVAFSDEEREMLVKKVGTSAGPEMAEYIHKVVKRSLNRKARKVKENVQL